MEGRNSRLILEAKPNERFILFDSISGLSTKIKVFYRENGNLALAFEAPSEIRISREEQWSVNGNGKRD
jgi:sRNA-binding carbon storage regulator CsrA